MIIFLNFITWFKYYDGSKPLTWNMWYDPTFHFLKSIVMTRLVLFQNDLFKQGKVETRIL